ncbi:peptidase s8 and s53 subtilisin kexin sedolisin [Grosmannia clavigera kw1407]|uniref:Peptidase s8 and s53 subtilisin kexin sedolisin n=1 Tax=Grosmannia clavigera (strain kw1407 / UAMH 11150) TaxID=655863 RepID=F0XH40_GROCL|nr:peptidase s8 and s53 subtilisin kexin sedolisin [Grosmannia clavigera kw1407]EFX03022.1 peptidase s8 and s53 subtilisin kexin sedolisin [Grosmannia clavigera kw1407]
MHRVPLIETYDGRITFLDACQVFNGTGEEMAGNGLRSEIPDNSPLICAIDNCLNSSLWEDSEGAALDNVAILDTGIDRGHYYIEAHEENLKGRFNCYNEAQKRNVQDRNGHGTFTTSLVLAYAQDAEIYIVKVADRENTRPDAKIVANAISHAVDEWGVDIISMSFGWPSSNFEGHSVLEAAIDKAYGKKVLMFAAASNSGGRLGRAYPASSTHVICVHSTNTNGTRSDFSPTAAPNAISIATIGESVESAWPVLLCGKDESNPKVCSVPVWDIICDTHSCGHRGVSIALRTIASGQRISRQTETKGRNGSSTEEVCREGPNYSPRDGYLFVELSLNSHNLFGNSLEEVNYEIKKALKT